MTFSSPAGSTLPTARSRGRAALVLAVVATGCRGVPVFDGSVVPTGHSEVLLEEGAESNHPARASSVSDPSVTALYLGDDRLGVCLLAADAKTDTSQWRLDPSFEGRRLSAEPIAPDQASGQHLCFTWPAPAQWRGRGRGRLCGAVLDSFDGSRRRLPCHQVAYRLDDRENAAIVAANDELMARSVELTVPELVAEVDALGARARAARLPVQEVQFQLIACHFLAQEGTPESVAAAGRRLDALPRWLDSGAASYLNGLATYQRASYQLTRGRVTEAWRWLAESERSLRRVLSDRTLATVAQQARILARVGTPREAATRLRAELERRTEKPGADGDDRDWFLQHARAQLAWLTLLDPDASRSELLPARDALGADLAGGAYRDDPLEQANQLINLGFLNQRLGEESDAIARARSLLRSTALGAEHRGMLLDWTVLVSALEQLESGAFAGAIAACLPLAERADPRVSAWATSCLARAQEALGRRRVAESLYQQAILRHQFGGERGNVPGQGLGASQEALDQYRLARVLIADGRAHEAWSGLAELDRVGFSEVDRRRCREGQSAGSPHWERWQQIEREAAGLLQALLENTGPGSLAWRAEQAERDRALKTRLLELWRELPGCAARPLAEAAGGVDLRAFWLDGELFVLERAARGARLRQRQPWARADLERLEDELASGAIGEPGRWRERLLAVGGALVPPRVDTPETVVTYGLHGRLQVLPLAALPAPGEGEGYLFDRAVPALRPAGARAAPAAPGPPLIVVDPQRNLGGSVELVGAYRRRFPGARILFGDTASRAAVAAALAQPVSWFHVDAHAEHDDAFPELSALQLADGPLHWLELSTADLRLSFANLSACESGRWPTSPGSGTWGLGGLLARRGARWVIASRDRLENRAALAFNAAFYQALAEGATVPAAYRAGLQRLRAQEPSPGRWAGLLLLGSEDDNRLEIAQNR